MQQLLSKPTATKFIILSVYQIAGGAAGLAITLYAAFTIPPVGYILLLFLVPVALYSYSIFCGWLLLKKKIEGLNYSLVNQYLQLVNFTIAGFTFKYVSGLLLSSGVDFNSFNLAFDFGIMSHWQISLFGNTENFEINLNLVALTAIFLINKIKKQTDAESSENELVNIY